MEKYYDNVIIGSGFSSIPVLDYFSKNNTDKTLLVCGDLNKSLKKNNFNNISRTLNKKQNDQNNNFIKINKIDINRKFNFLNLLSKNGNSEIWGGLFMKPKINLIKQNKIYDKKKHINIIASLDKIINFNKNKNYTINNDFKTFNYIEKFLSNKITIFKRFYVEKINRNNDLYKIFLSNGLHKKNIICKKIFFCCGPISTFKLLSEMNSYYQTQVNLKNHIFYSGIALKHKSFKNEKELIIDKNNYGISCLINLNSNLYTKVSKTFIGKIIRITNFLFTKKIIFFNFFVEKKKTNISIINNKNNIQFKVFKKVFLKKELLNILKSVFKTNIIFYLERNEGSDYHYYGWLNKNLKEKFKLNQNLIICDSSDLIKSNAFPTYLIMYKSYFTILKNFEK